MYERYIKRVLDIMIAFLALVLLSPLLLLVSVLVLFEDGWPVFFRQQRVGRFGRPFCIVKFRTMKVDSSSHRGSFDAGCGSRVTSLGRILRKYKIDELPQFVNVLIGDMSVIGPRPEISAWTEVYPEKWKIVLTKRPGITDWASIEFRHEEELLVGSADPKATYRTEILPSKLKYYLDYVSDVKFSKDFDIFYHTLSSLTRRKP